MKSTSPPHLRTFSYHYRQKYGVKVGKISVDLGHKCPNRKLGGCIFCNPAGFTPADLQKQIPPADQVKHGKRRLAKQKARKYLIYFQQETCTAVPVETLVRLVEQLCADESCVGVIFSTRPDYIPDELLLSLRPVMAQLQKECLFELGLQSVHDKSLVHLNRNHNYHSFTDAVGRIKEQTDFEVGAHLLFGIPGESENDMLSSVQRVCDLGINALKLHHLQVVKNTPLQGLYEQGEVKPYTLERYTSLLLKVIPHIPADVTIHRLWATCHPELLIAPKWNILATHLSTQLQQQMSLLKLRQGSALEKAQSV